MDQLARSHGVDLRAAQGRRVPRRQPVHGGRRRRHLHAILDPKTGSPARQNIGPIAKVAAKDDSTVVFTLVVALRRPAGDAGLHQRQDRARRPSSAPGLARLDREAIGTGPFKLVSFEPERLIVVTRNDAYYDKERPYLDRVEVVGLSRSDGRRLGADRRRHRPHARRCRRPSTRVSRRQAACRRCACRPASSATSTWAATRSRSTTCACARRWR